MVSKVCRGVMGKASRYLLGGLKENLYRSPTISINPLNSKCHGYQWLSRAPPVTYMSAKTSIIGFFSFFFNRKKMEEYKAFLKKPTCPWRDMFFYPGIFHSISVWTCFYPEKHLVMLWEGSWVPNTRNNCVTGNFFFFFLTHLRLLSQEYSVSGRTHSFLCRPQIWNYL